MIKQAIDLVALEDNRSVLYRAYYHTPYYLELDPGLPVLNDETAASAPIRPTVDNFDSQVSSSGVVATFWRDDRLDFSKPVAIGENAEADARDAHTVEENAIVLDEAMDD